MKYTLCCNGVATLAGLYMSSVYHTYICIICMYIHTEGSQTVRRLETTPRAGMMSRERYDKKCISNTPETDGFHFNQDINITLNQLCMCTHWYTYTCECTYQPSLTCAAWLMYAKFFSFDQLLNQDMYALVISCPDVQQHYI